MGTRVLIIKALLLGAAVGGSLWGAPLAAFAQEARPNILLIVAEDLSPRIGAYGDAVAQTPNIDALARQGVRFSNMFTVYGVCAPNRSALITGVYPFAVGTQHMRTADRVPDSEIRGYEAVPPAAVRAFPELLRAAGYATANFAKRDYQFGEPFTIWDVDVGDYISPLEPALWRELPADKPWFVMVNLMATHESWVVAADESLKLPEDGGWGVQMLRKVQQLRAKEVKAVTDPADVRVPPYYPDTTDVRKSIAAFYDNIHYMDGQVRQILDALQADGLADKTIVIWTTDHGDGLPRMKRSVYDSGLRVPFVVRYPDGYGKGTVDDRLASFVDLAPTILHMAGVEAPPFIQGVDFLAEDNERSYVFGARDRMSSVPDRVRAVSDGRYKYIRNYLPEEPYFRPLILRDMLAPMKALWAGHKDGSLTPVQGFYFTAPRPVEELYDTADDPDEIHNLAADADQVERLARMRAVMDGWLREVGDLSETPEKDMVAAMWPGLQQPVTSAPRALEIDGADGTPMAALSSFTPGASIGYRWLDAAGEAGPWLLYTSPVSLSDGKQLEAKAVRYGYTESAVTTFGISGGQ